MFNTATLKIFSPRRDNAQATDLSGIVFRTQKAIGGSLIEHMPTDARLPPNRDLLNPGIVV